MRTLNLSGFKPSDSLNISVSQGALTAGPINVPAWGGATPSGNISIKTHRSQMQVAPDSVRFWVDLSSSDFDTPAPAGGEVYDARLHDLIYLWNFGDPGIWTAPENVLPAWKDRNTAKGPFVMHMYPDPGTYSPSVLVIEPSSGKTAVAVLDGANAITVLDPDDVYPGTATICVNPVGDNDWIGAPAGAAKVNSNGLDFQQAPWTSNIGGAPKRWLFKRGGYFEQRVTIGSSTTPGVYFGAYGSGSKPKIANAPWVGGTSNVMENTPFGLAAYGEDADPSVPDIRFVHLHGFGTYDPVTMRSDYRVIDTKTASWLFNLSGCNLIMHECDFSGLQGSFLYNGINNPAYSVEQTLHLNHCTMTAFGGQYPLFGGSSKNEHSAMGVTGCRFVQTPGAVGSDAAREGSSRAIIRSNSPHRFHARGCDFYHTDQWQHCLKTPETPVEQGVLVNIHSCSFEGGVGAIVMNGNYSQAPLGPNSHVHNIVIDGVAVFSNHSTSMPFSALCTGVTIRNSLVVTPQIDRAFDAQFGFIRVITRGTFDADVVGAAPIQLYNNTYNFDKDPSNAVGWTDHGLMIYYNEYGQAFTNMVDENNVIHKPNAAVPVTTFAPLSDTQLFPHRDLGYRNTDPGWGLQSPLALTWANGETRAYPYGLAYGYIPVTQANFAGSSGKEQVSVGSSGAFAAYTLADGEIEVTYGASEILVKNVSGVNWIANGSTALILHLDMGTTAPIGTNTVPPSGSWKDSKPLPGSAALGAALTGDVSYMDITMRERPEPPSKGAWEAD